MNDIVSGALLFTNERSAMGYRINKLAMALTQPTERDRMKADEEGFMAEHGLSEPEKQLIRARDWKGMLEAGASIYLLLKIGAVTGHPLPVIGAHTAGRSA